MIAYQSDTSTNGLPGKRSMLRQSKKQLTGGVVAAVLEPLEPPDEHVEDLPPLLGRQEVDVREDSAHLGDVCACVFAAAERRQARLYNYRNCRTAYKYVLGETPVFSTRWDVQTNVNCTQQSSFFELNGWGSRLLLPHYVNAG